MHKSTKVWKLYLDLEESLGTVATTRAAYTRMMELRIVTPMLILNFASFLEENRYFEEAFTVYEKGVGAFRWPHVKPIWHRYLDKFLERYGSTKLELTQVGVPEEEKERTEKGWTNLMFDRMKAMLGGSVMG